MRVYKKKTIRRMKWYGVILVLSGIPLGIGMGRSLEEGRTFLLEESQTYAQKLYLPLFSYQKEQGTEREGMPYKAAYRKVQIAEKMGCSRNGRRRLSGFFM